MFIRLVVGHDGEPHRSLTGIVASARLLRDAGSLDQHEVARLEELYQWLNANLPCPPFSTSGWSREAVTWFKHDAGEPIRKLWEIALILRSQSVPVRLLRSANPGKVLFEDRFQVAVKEWREL